MTARGTDREEGGGGASSTATATATAIRHADGDDGDDDSIPPPPSRLLRDHNRVDGDDDNRRIVEGGQRPERRRRQRQPEEVASEVIHSLASYCRRRHRRRRRRRRPREDSSGGFDLDDIPALLTGWEHLPRTTAAATTSDATASDAGGGDSACVMRHRGRDPVGASPPPGDDGDDARVEFECALSLLGRVLSPHPASSSTSASDGLAPHELVRLAVECQYMTAQCDDDEDEEEEEDCHQSIRTPVVVSEASVLCVHLATVGLERALAETRRALAPSEAGDGEDDGDVDVDDDEDGGMGGGGGGGAPPIVAEEEGQTMPRNERKREKVVVRWRRLASTTGSALELSRRALVLPLGESCRRFVDLHDGGGGGGGWSDDDDHDEEAEEEVMTAGAEQSAETEKRRGNDVVEIRRATRVTNALLCRLVDAANSILRLVHGHHDDPTYRRRLGDQEHDRVDDVGGERGKAEKNGEKSNGATRVWTVTTHDVAAAGIVTEALDLTRTVHFSPPFRDRPGDGATADADRSGGDARDAGGRLAVRALSRRVLSSPLALNDVLVHPLRVEARERRRVHEESEGYLRDAYGDCDLYGDDDPDNISDHRLERFRVDVARRYFDGEVPLHARGVAVLAQALLCGEGDDDDEGAAGGNPLPVGVLSHSCLWRWFYPQASTLLLSGDVGMACDLLAELNGRVPTTASLDCWREVVVGRGGRGVNVALDPTSPMGVVGTVQLLMNVIVNNSGDPATRDDDDDGGRRVPSSSSILALVRSLVGRVGNPARQIECVSILVERCPYPSVTPILLDLAGPALSSLGRETSTASGGGDDGGVDGGEAGGGDGRAEDEARRAISALVRTVSPFLDRMRGYRGAEEAVVDGRRGGKEDPETDPVAPLMENHEAFHACATLLGLPCRSAASRAVAGDVLRRNVPFREAVDTLREFRDVLGARLRTWSSADGGGGVPPPNDGGDDGDPSTPPPPPPPVDFFRLYLLEDAVASTVGAAEEAGVLPAASDTNAVG